MARTFPLLVLVVEDHVDTRDLYIDVLEHMGFVARGVSDVASARQLLFDGHFDVSITDYTLAGGTAKDLVAPPVPMPELRLLVTGHRATDVDNDGFHAVLTMPINIAHLIELILVHAGTKVESSRGRRSG